MQEPDGLIKKGKFGSIYTRYPRHWRLLRTKGILSLIRKGFYTPWVHTSISPIPESSTKRASLPSDLTQVTMLVFCQNESHSHCALSAALTGALVYSAMFYIQPRLWVLVSVAFWLVSFEKGDRNVHKGHVLIFIFRQIFTTLNNYQEKEATAINKLWTRNAKAILIQAVRSGDCQGSVK